MLAGLRALHQPVRFAQVGLLTALIDRVLLLPMHLLTGLANAFHRDLTKEDADVTKI